MGSPSLPLADEASLLDTAAEHATARVPIAAPHESSRAVFARIVDGDHDSVTDVAVCDGDHFVRLLRLEDLMAASPSTPMAALMDPEVPILSRGVDQETAAWQLVQHGERSLPVSDADGRFVGLVPPTMLLRGRHGARSHGLAGPRRQLLLGNPRRHGPAMAARSPRSRSRIRVRAAGNRDPGPALAPGISGHRRSRHRVTHIRRSPLRRPDLRTPRHAATMAGQCRPPAPYHACL